MYFNKLISRVKSILLTPRTEWPVIAAEPATMVSLYTGYILLLAALPAVSAFLKFAVFGYSLPFLGTMHVGAGFALNAAVRSYVGSVVGVYVLALIVNALAPTFGGQKDSVQALKVVAYSYTAGWIAGIAVLLPWLGTLLMLAGMVYGIYLLYLGLPVTMKCPPEKATGYTVVTLICAILLGTLVFFILGSVLGLRSGLGMAGLTSERGSSITLDRDSAGGKAAQWAQGVAEAGKQLESAQKSGDSAAQATAVGKMVASAVGGGAQVEALAPDRLKAFLPDTLGGLKRIEAAAERNGAIGMQVASATARYADDADHSLRLEITDMGSARGVMAFASHANVEMDRQTDTGYEKTYHQGGKMIHEQWDSASKRGEYGAVVGERFNVKIQGDGIDIGTLKAALGSVNLAGLEALRNEGVKAN